MALSAGGIAGVAVAGIALVGIAGTFAFFAIRRRNSTSTSSSTPTTYPAKSPSFNNIPLVSAKTEYASVNSSNNSLNPNSGNYASSKPTSQPTFQKQKSQVELQVEELLQGVNSTIDFREISTIEQIGEGGFGTVWKANWRGKIVAGFKLKVEDLRV